MPRAATLLQEGEAEVDRLPSQVILTRFDLMVMLIVYVGACVTCRLCPWPLRAAAARLDCSLRRSG
jgi:hypothetical protein